MQLRVTFSLLLFSTILHGCISTVPDPNRWKQRETEFDSIMTILKTPPAKHEMPVVKPQDFAFRFESAYGNILDTFHHTFTKDMVFDPDTTIPFTLSPLQMDSVYSIMRAMNLFNFPQYWSNELRPRKRIKFLIQLDSLKRSCTFDLSFESTKGDTTMAVRTLNQMIYRMIESSPAVKALPKPRGAYCGY